MIIIHCTCQYLPTYLSIYDTYLPTTTYLHSSSCRTTCLQPAFFNVAVPLMIPPRVYPSSRCTANSIYPIVYDGEESVIHPPICLSICLSLHSYMYLSIHPPSIYTSILSSKHTFIHSSTRPYLHLSIYLSIHLFIHPSIYSSIYE
jgi:hypothetical protein